MSYPEWTDEQITQTIKGVFRTQGLVVIEMLRVVGNAKDNPLDKIDCDPEIIQKIDELLSQGKGCLVLTAHINNYEMLMTWAAQRYPLSVIAKNIKPPSLDDWLQESRRRNGVNILARRASYRDAMRVLRKGELLGFIIDQNMKRGSGVHVTFFNRPANTSDGLAMLSAHSGAPVVPACMYRVGNRYQIRMYPIVESPADRKPETLHAATQKYTNAVEAMIREQPESWIWIHRRWKTKPKEGNPITRPDGSTYYA